MSKCKHTRSWYSTAEVLVARRFAGSLAMGQRQCERCRAILSLGPSNDADERVRIEIRAAELAADCSDQTDLPTDLMEWAGWVSHKEGHDVSNGRALAGWLAREIEIVTHEETP